MSARELLESYGALREEAGLRLYELRALRARRNSGQAPSSRERDLLARCRTLQRKMKSRQKQLTCLLAQLDSQSERLVLESRYLQGMSYEDISLALNFSPRHIYRLHLRGVTALNAILGAQADGQ